MSRIAIVSALALVSACHTHAPPRASSLADAWLRAIGGRDALAKLRSVHAIGRVEQGGLAGAYERWETVRGERREERTLGAVDHEIDVFDGTRGWLVDRNRVVRELAGPELAEQRALAFLAAGAALIDGRRPGRATERGATLVIEPTDGKVLAVTFDPATHLPAAIARQDADKVRTLKLSDWRDVGGVRFPFALEDTTGDPRDAVIVHLDRVETDGAPPPFVRPADGPRDWHLDAAHATVPIELVRGLPVVQVRVNGSAPLAFIVDTGAEVTVINASRLAALHLVPVGALAIGGGGGDASMAYVADVSFALPGATLDHQIVTAVPLDPLEPLFGHPIDGVLGYDFLSRFVIALDYDRKTMVLSDPAMFAYAGTGTALPITLEGGVANTDATIVAGAQPALRAHFVVDTGCSCEVQFYSPFTRTHKLVEVTPGVVKPPPGLARGVGGETESLIGHLTSVAVAGHVVARPLAEFGQDASGGNADPEAAGLLGSSLWRRFVITLDYPHQRIFVEPAAHFADPSDAIGVGAVWIAQPGGAIVVMAVFPGSPAAIAGLAPGDRLVSFDGKPAATLTVDDVSLADAKVGDAHAVVVMRDGKERAIALVAKVLF